MFARLEQECTEREYEIYRTEPIGRWLTPEESERIVVGYDPVNMKYGIFSDVNDEVALDVTSQQDIQCADEVAVDQFLVACVAGGADA